jgi:hypothetical protein
LLLPRCGSVLHIQTIIPRTCIAKTGLYYEERPNRLYLYCSSSY